MGRIERILIGLCCGFLILAVPFTLSWWSTAALARLGPAGVPESAVAASALTGLGLGAVLNLFFLKRLIPNFYRIPPAASVAAYLVFSVMAVAAFMGLPAGNLALGTAAGAYAGRRSVFRGVDAASSRKAARIAARFTACVTGIEALPAGLLALREPDMLHAADRAAGLNVFGSGTATDVLVILGLCLVLSALQYGLTRAAAEVSFRM